MSATRRRGFVAVSKNSTLRRRRDRGLDGGEVRHVDRRHADPAPREVVLEQHPRDHEQLVADDDVVAAAEVREQRRRDAGHPGRRRRPRPRRRRARRASPRARASSGCRSASRSTTSGPSRAPGRPRPPSPPRCRRRTSPWRRSACCGRGSRDPGASPAWIARVAKPRPCVRSRFVPPVRSPSRRSAAGSRGWRSRTPSGHDQRAVARLAAEDLHRDRRARSCRSRGARRATTRSGRCSRPAP